jgi:tartrate-resistant acid phosphatase type 5
MFILPVKRLLSINLLLVQTSILNKILLAAFVKMKIILFLLIMVGFAPVQAQVYIRESAPYKQADSMLTQKAGVLNFLAMGDWGRNGADHQKEVAAQMGKTAAAVNASFIISTGDNFYPSGVMSELDPLFKYSFEDIYTAFSLQWDWYPILGNHDYKSNPDAQVAYSKISRRWKMPSRYYAKTFAINGDTTQQVLIAFIDTNPLIAEFYKNPEYGPNVRSQDSAVQKKWLEQVLSNPSQNIRWKIVVGHHPMFTGGSRTDAYDTKAIHPVEDCSGPPSYVHRRQQDRCLRYQSNLSFTENCSG